MGDDLPIIDPSAAQLLWSQSCPILEMPSDLGRPTIGTIPPAGEPRPFVLISENNSDLFAASPADGMFRLFRPRTTTGDSTPIPDLTTVSPEDYEAWIERSGEQYARQQRDQLLTNFQPCRVYRLNDEYHLLPEMIVAGMASYVDDRSICFVLEMTVNEQNEPVPQVRFFRMDENAPQNPLGIRSGIVAPSEEDDGSSTPFGTFAAAGLLATRLPSPNEGPGRGTNPEVTAGVRFPVLSIGGAVAMYAFVDWTVVNQLGVPENSPYRGLLDITGSVALYQGTYVVSEGLVSTGVLQRGFMARPNWGAMGEALPHIVVLQTGAAFLYDGIGVAPIGSTENQLLSFGTSLGAYSYGAPAIAARFPTFSSSVGGRATVGASRLAGRVLIANWALGVVFSIAGLDGNAEDPDMALMMRAWDQDIHNRWWYFGDVLNPLFKTAGGIIMACSDEGQDAYYELHTTIIRQWISGVGELADQTDGFLTEQALAAIQEGPTGEMEIDWSTVETGMRSFFRPSSDDIAQTYEMITLLDRSVFHNDTTRGAREMTRLVASDGSIVDRDAFRRHVTERALGTARYQLSQEMARRGLDQPVAESDLTFAQRSFLYSPETATMIRRIRFLEQLQG